ncbi:hypothetical protein Dfri01_59100 [Dyadobacter frigoris]|uniref:hypothetical protein n=1 Tax=Dyadobacter frigoris TaxID=2576211 RepID=UPI0024A2F8CB|nr:hypothetical protein [Dyadobacter frigoris]GLU56449.1 hypothetical protein Dfri01_59100 [Dyadobacter frigoris]
MDYKIIDKCFYCSKPTAYLVGVSKATWKKKIDVTGECCEEHIKNALDKIGNLAFGTSYWPAVANLSRELIYHSFQADLHKLSFTAGWDEYILQSKKALNKVGKKNYKY